jgi:uncharacterized Zn-binding protein involved in type VI secretion
MMSAIVRLGDSSTHGGSIISTVINNIDCNGLNVAVVGSMLDCPIHGVNPIVSSPSKITASQNQLATVGSVCRCGAILNAGSPDVSG